MFRHLLALGIALVAQTAVAAIEFEDVTATAGPFHTGSSWGASWGDLNGDGRPDLYAGNHQQRGSLWRNNGDGTFTDVILTVDRPAIWLSDQYQDDHGATWADYDNDGDQDLLAARSSDSGRLQLMVNSGGLFTEEKAVSLGLGSFSGGRMAVWMDYNNDGLLDVGAMGARYAEVYRQGSTGFTKTTSSVGMSQKCYHDNYAQLMDATGDGRPEFICGTDKEYPERVFDTSTSVFADVTTLMYQDPLVPDVALADFNNDLKIDMFRLRGRTRPSEVRVVRPGRLEAYLSVSSDSGEKGYQFAADGPIDLVFADLERETVDSGAIYVGSGGWQPSTLPFTLEPTDSSVFGLPTNRSATGIYIGFNTLSQQWEVQVSPGSTDSRAVYIAIEGGVIESPIPLNFSNSELPMEPSLVMDTGSGYERVYNFGIGDLWCKSAVAGDFDNDTDVDLFLACGGTIQNLANRVFENQGDGTFVEVTDAGGAAGVQGAGLEGGAGASDSVVMADYDLDGFLDVFVTNGILLVPIRSGGPDQLFRNKGNENHWIELDLEGSATNRSAIGAKVYAYSNGTTQLREQNGGYHRWSQDHSRIHFGLAGELTVDLTVEWPSGQVDQYVGVQADRLYRVVEGGLIEPVVPGPVPALPAPQAGDECGEPLFDEELDQATFLWKDCTSNQWRFRVAAGGVATPLTYSGQLASTDDFQSVAGISLEGGDVVDTTDPSQVAFSLGVSAVGTDGVDFKEAGSGACTRVEWQAESGVVKGAFAVRSDSKASGGYYVGASSGSRSSPNPNDGVTFTVDVAAAGTYQIEAVVQATSSSQDSFWVQVDNGPYWQYNTVRTSSGQYLTDFVNDVAPNPDIDPVSVTLTPGQHVLRFLLRESGTRLDKVALVPTSCDAVPTETKTCLRLDSPTGAKLYLGRNRLPAPLPLNLSTLTSAGCSDARVSIDDVTVLEGDGSAEFRVSLSEPSAETVTLEYVSSDGTAIGGSDFGAIATPLTMEFAPLTTSQTISIPIYTDAEREGDESFFVTLTNPIGATIDRGTGTGTIQGDSSISCGAPAYDKGTEPGVFVWEDCGTGVWHVRVSGGGNPTALNYLGWVSSSQPIVGVTGFSIESNDQLSLVAADRIAYGLIVANSGQDGFDFPIQAGAEGCFSLDAPAGTSVRLGTGRTPVTVPFDLKTLGPCELAPSLAIADVTIDEAAGVASFAVSLSAASNQTVTVDYATGDGTATADEDYSPVSGTIAFPPGETTGAVSVAILDDGLSEPAEVFSLTLSHPANATVADGAATGTIQDNEPSSCGAPVYDKATESGLYLWEDCDSGLWHVRVTGGGSPTNLKFQGLVTAPQAFAQVTGFSLEANDALSAPGGLRIDYALNVANSGQDGFEFIPAQAPGGCFALDGPLGAAVRVGAGRALMTTPFDLDTLAPCELAQP